MTPARFVLDASVAAKCFFAEGDAQSAWRWVLSGASVIAPDLLPIEIASVASSKVRRGETDLAAASDALHGVYTLVDEMRPAKAHLDRALALAADHGFSAYDALYLAVAEAEGCSVVTADRKLVARAAAAGLGGLVRDFQGAVGGL